MKSMPARTREFISQTPPVTEIAPMHTIPDTALEA
jgi:hypothetical protein